MANKQPFSWRGWKFAVHIVFEGQSEFSLEFLSQRSFVAISASLVLTWSETERAPDAPGRHAEVVETMAVNSRTVQDSERCVFLGQ